MSGCIAGVLIQRLSVASGSRGAGGGFLFVPFGEWRLSRVGSICRKAAAFAERPLYRVWGGLLLIEVDDDVLGAGTGLAGEDKSLLDFPVFEGVIDIHGYVALLDFGAAGTAYAAFAGKG